MQKPMICKHGHGHGHGHKHGQWTCIEHSGRSQYTYVYLSFHSIEQEAKSFKMPAKLRRRRHKSIICIGGGRCRKGGEGKHKTIRGHRSREKRKGAKKKTQSEQ